MFALTASFNQDLSVWDVSKVVNFHAMFNGSTSFQQDLCPWHDRIMMNNETVNMTNMFANITSCFSREDPNLDDDDGKTTKGGSFCYPCDWNVFG